MKNLNEYIVENLSDHTVYLIKTADECKKYLKRKIGKGDTTLQDSLGISDINIDALYQYVNDNNMPAPIVGCYNNTQFGTAFRRWFNENVQCKILNSEHDSFTFNKESKYFKNYHNTGLKEDGKFVPTAQDMEEIISYAYNNLYCKMEDDANCNAVGINEKKRANIINYYIINKTSIDAIAKVLHDRCPCSKGYGKLKNFSKKNIKDEWADLYENGTPNGTPKTDIISLDNKNSYRISLKKAGGSQIMSAKIDEAKATLLFAVEPLEENIKCEVLPILCNLLNVNETDKKRKENTEEIFDEFGPEYLNGKTLKERMNEDAEFSALIKNSKKKGKDFEAQLNTLLSEYKTTYKKSFYIEAMTGNHKFTEDSKCAANFVFVWDDVKNENTKIYNVDEYYEHIKDDSNVVVDFKSWPTSNRSGQTLKIITK